MKKYLIALIPILIALAGCGDEIINNPVAPRPSVIISPAINCAATVSPGAVRVDDSSTSTPPNSILRVTGQLFNAAGSNVCNFTIERQGNLGASAICDGLAAGAYHFTALIVPNSDETATSADGECSAT